MSAMEVRTWWTTLLLLLLLLLLAHAAAARKTRRHSSAGPTTKDWAQLSPAEREAAIAAGYRVESWRAYAHFGKLRSAIMNLEVPWSQMPAGLQQAHKTLGWTAKSWQNVQSTFPGISPPGTPTFTRLSSRFDAFQGSAIHVAASMDYFLPVEDLNVQVNGENAACVAARAGYLRTLQELVDAGVKVGPEYQCSEGLSVYVIIALKGPDVLAKMLANDDAEQNRAARLIVDGLQDEADSHQRANAELKARAAEEDAQFAVAQANVVSTAQMTRVWTTEAQLEKQRRTQQTIDLIQALMRRLRKASQVIAANITIEEYQQNIVHYLNMENQEGKEVRSSKGHDVVNVLAMEAEAQVSKLGEAVTASEIIAPDLYFTSVVDGRESKKEAAKQELQHLKNEIEAQINSTKASIAVLARAVDAERKKRQQKLPQPEPNNYDTLQRGRATFESATAMPPTMSPVNKHSPDLASSSSGNSAAVAKLSPSEFIFQLCKEGRIPTLLSNSADGNVRSAHNLEVIDAVRKELQDDGYEIPNPTQLADSLDRADVTWWYEAISLAQTMATMDKTIDNAVREDAASHAAGAGPVPPADVKNDDVVAVRQVILLIASNLRDLNSLAQQELGGQLPTDNIHSTAVSKRFAATTSEHAGLHGNDEAHFRETDAGPTSRPSPHMPVVLTEHIYLCLIVGISSFAIGSWFTCVSRRFYCWPCTRNLAEEQVLALQREICELRESISRAGLVITSAGSCTPQAFLDPIDHELMTDPVVTAAGNTYQRATIETWFRAHQTDPLSNSILATKRLVKNNLVRSQVKHWMQSNVNTSSKTFGNQVSQTNR